RLKKSFIGCKGNIVYNERREKQAAASADICFSQVINEGSACVRAPLTKVPPASAGSGARQHGNLSIRAQLKK
ncbi:MAG: hypothetical protein V8R59_02855, partial [Enterocloster sp.]